MLSEFIITPHAQERMNQRGNTEEQVRTVVTEPEQEFDVRPGRIVMQSRLSLGATTLLLRVFMDVDRKPAEVTTVYLTDKIAKYWRT